MTTATDPFTKASPTYQAALRHPHKTGQGTEGLDDFHYDGPHPLVIAGIFIVIMGLVAVAIATASVKL